MRAEEYAAYANHVHVTIGEDDEKTFEEYIEDAFNAGMQEMREQIMKNAVDGEITYGKSLAIPSLAYILDKNGMEFGDKIKLIIIKQ